MQKTWQQTLLPTPSSFLQFCATLRVVSSCFRVFSTMFTEISYFRSCRARGTSTNLSPAGSEQEELACNDENTEYGEKLHLTRKDTLSNSNLTQFQAFWLKRKFPLACEVMSLRSGTGILVATVHFGVDLVTEACEMLVNP